MGRGLSTSRPRRARGTAFRSAVAFAIVAAVLPLATAAVADTPVFTDGFESGNLSSWTISSGVTVQSTDAFAGTFAAQAVAAGGRAYASRELGSTHTDLRASTAFKLVSQGANPVNVLRFQPAGGASNVLTVFVSQAGNLSIRNDVAGQTTSSGTVVTPGVWHQLSVRVVIAGGAGSVEVTLDGSVVAALTKTVDLGSTPVGRVMVGDNSVGRTFTTRFDAVDVQVPTVTDTQPPTAPTNLHTTSVTASRVDLAWNPSTDNVGVTSYQVYRNGSLLQTLPGTQTSYGDTTVAPGTSYVYALRAGDAAGNVSAPSADLPVTTPATGDGVVFADGFESGTLGAWTTSQGTTVQSTDRFTGAFAAQGTATSSKAFASRELGSVHSELIFTAAFKRVSQGANSINVLRFQPAGGATNILTLFLNQSGNLSHRNDVAGQATSSTQVVSTGVWHQLELRVLVAGASSTVEVKLDGVVVPALTKTLNLGTTPIGRVMLGDNGNKTFTARYDDVSVRSPGDDTEPPTTPGNLRTTSVTSQSVVLAWDPSTDNVAVTQYEVSRGGVVLATVPGTQTTFTDGDVDASTTYLYSVRAGDDADNFSTPAQLSVTTPGLGGGEVLAANHFPMWQTNGIVWGMAATNGVVYLGGDFTSVRPPGSPPGSGEVARNRIAAFDANTGALLPFQHDMNGIVRELTVSPDGTRLYAGGNFTTVDGVTRNRIAAFRTSDGVLISTFTPSVWAQVNSIAVTDTTVYIGGTFGTVNNTTRNNLAAFDLGGALLPWNPSTNAAVDEVAVAGGGTRVIVGGYFTQLNGQSFNRLGSVDPVSGANEAWAYDIDPFCSGGLSDVKSIVAFGDNVYVGAEGTGGGCFDGTLAARASDGELIWLDRCLGATQAVIVIGSFLYAGNHAHNCNTVPGGFPEQTLAGATHFLAESLADGSIQHWFPDTSGGIGPRAFATDGDSLFVGGEFTSVNGQAQEGVTRFELGPDLSQPFKPTPPTLSSCQAGAISVSWRTTWDRDDQVLEYRVYRDGGSTPIHTISAASAFWTMPVLSFVDGGLAPGSTHTYRVRAFEPDTTSAMSDPSAPFTVPSSSDAYSTAVAADAPSMYWRLAESSGTTATDCGSPGGGGVYFGGPSLNVAGAITGNSAVSLDGNNDLVSSSTLFTNPQVFSIELWFRTNDTTGGKLVGFGNSQSGNSGNYDRHIYMTNSGNLRFGVFSGSAVTIETPSSYRDDLWHHAVATLSSAGMRLYVDGVLRASNTSVTTAQNYNGYWRLGGDNLNGWPSRPSGNYINARVDEFAYYTTALSATRVLAHYQARS